MFDINVDPNQIFTSAIATAAYLTLLVPKVKQYMNKLKILLIGSQGLYNTLQHEIQTQHIKDVSIVWTRKIFDQMKASELVTMNLDPEIAIIIVGFDYFYGYKDISLVCRYLHEQKHKMHLIGTNDDTTYPAKPGVFLPGSGSLLAAIKAVSPIEMQTCGKPNKLLFDIIKQKHNEIDTNKCLIIGDRIDTDIIFGLKAGIKTALVMTGITTETLLKQSDVKPTFVLQSIRDLL